jgi:hypothetical protein
LLQSIDLPSKIFLQVLCLQLLFFLQRVQFTLQGNFGILTDLADLFLAPLLESGNLSVILGLHLAHCSPEGFGIVCLNKVDETNNAVVGLE